MTDFKTIAELIYYIVDEPSLVAFDERNNVLRCVEHDTARCIDDLFSEIGIATGIVEAGNGDYCVETDDYLEMIDEEDE